VLIKAKILISTVTFSRELIINKNTLASLLSCFIIATSVGLNAAQLKSLGSVLAPQNESTKARYSFRNPNQTLAFFGIQPGMKVAEGLPGGGWYSKILLSYLGEEGELVGVDYPLDIWQHFSFASEEYIEAKESWAKAWTNQAKGWGVESSAKISAYTFATLPEALNGQLDAVLLIRMLHNLARHEDKGRYLGDALATTFRVLKQDGIVGIVQHQAREDRSDGWADGNAGYLKKSVVIAAMEKAGFELVAQSDINTNEKDQAGEGDKVWRLPPSLRTSDDNIAATRAIGESHRMTLKFRKPQK